MASTRLKLKRGTLVKIALALAMLLALLVFPIAPASAGGGGGEPPNPSTDVVRLSPNPSTIAVGEATVARIDVEIHNGAAWDDWLLDIEYDRQLQPTGCNANVGSCTLLSGRVRFTDKVKEKSGIQPLGGGMGLGSITFVGKAPTERWPAKVIFRNLRARNILGQKVELIGVNATVVVTQTPTVTPTASPTPTSTSTPTKVPTNTPTATFTASPTSTPTVTTVPTSTATPPATAAPGPIVRFVNPTHGSTNTTYHSEITSDLRVTGMGDRFDLWLVDSTGATVTSQSYVPGRFVNFDQEFCLFGGVSPCYGWPNSIPDGTYQFWAKASTDSVYSADNRIVIMQRYLPTPTATSTPVQIPIFTATPTPTTTASSAPYITGTRHFLNASNQGVLEIQGVNFLPTPNASAYAYFVDYRYGGGGQLVWSTTPGVVWTDTRIEFLVPSQSYGNVFVNVNGVQSNLYPVNPVL